MIKNPVKFTLSTIFLLSCAAFSTVSQATIVPYMPRASIEGLSNTNDNNLNADVLLPLVGNREQMVFMDVQGKTLNDHKWAYSIGAGYRQTYSCDRIFGAYLFADVNNVHARHRNDQFAVISPGIESLGLLWDFRANAYISVGKKQRTLDTFIPYYRGNFKYESFVGHQEFSSQLKTVQTIGSGADAEIGRIFPCFNSLHAFVGAYYFAPRHVKKITGAEARLEYPTSRYITLLASDNYDNTIKNVFMLGVRFNLGAENPYSCDIHDHMTDKVHRNLGALDYGSSVPIRKTTYATGKKVVVRSNIWFFKPAGDPGEINASMCTFEHPCDPSMFTQDNIDAINDIAPNANFYLAPANYIPGSAWGLNSGQSVYGRSRNFKAPAYIKEVYPNVLGSVFLTDNNLLDSIMLLNNPNDIQIVGVSIGGTNVEINHSTIGALNGDYGFTFGVTAIDSQNVYIRNSTINAFSNLPSFGGINGVVAIAADNSKVWVTNSHINAQNLVVGDGFVASTIGVAAVNTSDVVVRNSTINDTAVVTGDNAFLFDSVLFAALESQIGFTGQAVSTLIGTGSSPVIVADGLVTSVIGSHIGFRGTLDSNATFNGKDFGGVVSTLLAVGDQSLVDFDGKAKSVVSVTGNNSMLPNAFPDVDSFGIFAVGENANVNFKGVLSNIVNVNGNNHVTNVSSFFVGNDATVNFTGVAITKNETSGFSNVVNAQTVDALYGLGDQAGKVYFKGKAIVGAYATGRDSIANANLFAVDNMLNSKFIFTGKANINAKAVGNNVIANANGLTTANQANVLIDQSVLNINSYAEGPNSTAQSHGVLIGNLVDIGNSMTVISNSEFNVRARGGSTSQAIGINNDEIGSSVTLLNSTFSMDATRGNALAKAILLGQPLNLTMVNSSFFCNGVNCLN